MSSIGTGETKESFSSFEISNDVIFVSSPSILVMYGLVVSVTSLLNFSVNILLGDFMTSIQCLTLSMK